MLKVSTMAISLLAIALGVHLQSVEQAEFAFASNALRPTRSQPAGLLSEPEAITTIFDPVMIPGESVGPITAQTSHSDLAKLFDSARLTDVEALIGEGFTQPGTRVDLGENRSFTVIWADASRTQVAEVRELGSAWHTPEGIQAGMSMAELEQVLGPFQLYGFAWDYGGTVKLEGTRLARYEAQLIVRLQPSQADAHQTEAFRKVIGDGLFASNHRSFETMNPVVDEIVVSLKRPGRS